MLDIRDLTKVRLDDLNSLVNASSQRFESSLSSLTKKLDEGLAILADEGSGTEDPKATENESVFMRCVQDLRELAKTISEHNTKLVEIFDDRSHLESAEGPLASFLSVLEELKQKVDQVNQRGSKLAAGSNGAAPNDNTTYDAIMNDIIELVLSLEKATCDCQKALRRVAVSQDFRTIRSATMSTPWEQAQAILIDGADKAQPSTETETLNVQATIKPRCSVTCICRCHEVTTALTPKFLSRTLGRFILSYNSIPVWNSRACNHPRCLKNSQTSVHLNYLFPSWMPRLALAISASWDSVVGSGASLYLNVPRVVPEHSEIFRAINSNNVSRIQWLFSNRMFLPSDINEDGVCLLTVMPFKMTRLYSLS